MLIIICTVLVYLFTPENIRTGLMDIITDQAVEEFINDPIVPFTQPAIITGVVVDIEERTDQRFLDITVNYNGVIYHWITEEAVNINDSISNYYWGDDNFSEAFLEKDIGVLNDSFE